MKISPLPMKLLLVLIGYGYFVEIQSARALELDIEITGVVFIPPCKINDNNTEIKVSFDKMSLYEVDGYKNAKTKTVTVSCDYHQGTPYIRIEGEVLSGAGDNVLKTSGVNSTALGIALYQGQDVNTAYPLRIGPGEQGQYGYKIIHGLTENNTAIGQFTFTAVPQKYGVGTLNAGAFSAIATMSISYL